MAIKLSKNFPDYYILYFDLDDNLSCIFNLKDTNVPINLKHISNYKIYFDQKHTIGTDIDISSSAKSLLTINSMNTYTAIVQGLYRMREINYNQTNAFLIKEIHLTNSTYNSKLDELIKYIKSNDVKYLQTSKSKYYEQKILTALRSIEPNKDSYKYVAFNPSSEMSDQITIKKTFNHDYQKNQFIDLT
jgi:hypothetical protein